MVFTAALLLFMSLSTDALQKYIWPVSSTPIVAIAIKRLEYSNKNKNFAASQLLQHFAVIE